MSKKRACIIAAGMSDFGVRQAHIVDLFQKAAKRCLDDRPVLISARLNQPGDVL